MRIFLLVLLSFCLVSCDGIDIESTENTTEDTDQTFTRPELAFNVLFSSLILNDSGISNREGFIVLFDNTAMLTQIRLRSNDNDSAVIGTYPWVISNNKLQVTYPNNIVCTSSKTSETSSQYRATSSCSGGEPTNAQIKNTLIKSPSLNEDNFSREAFTINNGNDDFRMNFFSDGRIEIVELNSAGNEISSSTVTGTFEDSDVYKNLAVKLDLPSEDEYRLLFRLNGSLNSGTLLELRFTTTTDKLKSVYIYNAGDNNRWDVESVYDDIRFD